MEYKESFSNSSSHLFFAIFPILQNDEKNADQLIHNIKALQVHNYLKEHDD